MGRRLLAPLQMDSTVKRFRELYALRAVSEANWGEFLDIYRNLGSRDDIDAEVINAVFDVVRDPTDYAEADHINAELASLVTGMVFDKWAHALFESLPSLRERAPGFMIDLISQACLKDASRFVGLFEALDEATRRNVGALLTGNPEVSAALSKGRYTKVFFQAVTRA